MSKLKCNERECKHNHFCICNKQCIVLDDDAVCVSFQKRQPTDTKFSYELGGDITPSYSEMETAISCNDLSCYYNKDCCCKASDVKIDCDAWCETYRRK